MARPLVLGVVGDSGAGKTTLTRGLMRVLGDRHTARLSADDYHRFDRRQRAELGVTPLHPDCNHLDILTQHLELLRRGEPVLKPVYDHRRGTLDPPLYMRPSQFLLVEGLLSYHSEPLRGAHDVRVFVDPPESLRRAWKLKRDCTRRGYTTDEVLAELDRRERDAQQFIAPQREFADIVVRFKPGADPAHLDADVELRDTLPHPDLSPLAGVAVERLERAVLLRIPGAIDPDHAERLEHAVWERMSFANHLRVTKLGEFTVGTDLRRSDTLALVQLLILYQVMWARHEQRSTGASVRRLPRRSAGDDSALFL
ncbi:MAG TPA: phosphoribulokinase [Solirubrobacteraceae bacterium]|jgi:phosphoribulokinase|nr:phosphoribulokinase [Solirubrobacteraceae bacterium]